MARFSPTKGIGFHKLQIIRFLLVGLFTSIIELSLFTLLIDLFRIKYLHANLLAMAIAIIVNYSLTRRLVFEGGRYNGKVAFTVFSLFTLFGVLLNQFLLWFLVEQTHVQVNASKGLALGAVSAFNYFAKKHVVFRK